MSTSSISISNTGAATEGQTTISNGTGNENITFTFSNANGDVTSMFDLPEAHINIFDSEYYLAQNPNVAASLTTEYADTGRSITTVNANLPKLGISGLIQSGENPVPIDDEIIANSNSLEHSVALEDYVTTGTPAGVDPNPSPLFNSEYYLQQNPDVAQALAGGSFNGDPLLHYVTSGAAEGRDPNPFFDSDYYVAENSGVAESGLNPLEHYVLSGSSQGADPSANFDSEFYLAQNQDVAAAGIDPLTHFLAFGQDEGRLAIAE